MDYKLFNPASVSAMIAGGTLVGAYKFASTGQQLEEQGAPLSSQVTHSIASGFSGTVAGAGIGFGGATAIGVAKSLIKGK